VKLGLIADTHGWFDPRVAEAFRGVDAILHAGDVGSEEVLDQLGALARVTAVAGNNDGALAHLGLPLWADLILDNVRVHLVHRLQDGRPPDGTRVVVFGHSHRPVVELRDGVLLVNPGAAGRVGFHRALSVALLEMELGRAQAEVILLGPRPAPLRPARSPRAAGR